MNGAILEQGENYYTDLKIVFQGLSNIHLEYNWLITDIECYSENKGLMNILSESYLWLRGEELDSIINTEELQWIWGVFTGFREGLSYNEIIKFELPYAEGNSELFRNPIRLQNPLSELEIVAFDSSKTLFISRDYKKVMKFRESFPLSEDLETYNNRLKLKDRF